MRPVLIDRAQWRRAVRSGGEYKRANLQGDMLASPEEDEQLLALNDALERLERKHPIQARVVKLRYFAGKNQFYIGDGAPLPANDVQRHIAARVKVAARC